ncbi:MAG TPA: hypothetical protein VN939_15535 [Chthoniobacterales bacterium]|nr:hypothetical protein [Chthoniobacterales bacterium]
MTTVGIVSNTISKIETWVAANPPTVPYATWESSLDQQFLQHLVGPTKINEVNAWMTGNPPNP